MTQRVQVSRTTTASPEQVWALLGDVTTWPRWTPFTAASYEREGTPAPHGTGAVRLLRLAGTTTREQVLRWEPPRSYAYDYSGVLPLQGYRGEVELVPEAGGTRITWTGTFANGLLTGGPALAVVLRLVLVDLLRRLDRAAARG